MEGLKITNLNVDTLFFFNFDGKASKRKIGLVFLKQKIRVFATPDERQFLEDYLFMIARHFDSLIFWIEKNNIVYVCPALNLIWYYLKINSPENTKRTISCNNQCIEINVILIINNFFWFQSCDAVWILPVRIYSPLYVIVRRKITGNFIRPLYLGPRAPDPAVYFYSMTSMIRLTPKVWKLKRRILICLKYLFNRFFINISSWISWYQWWEQAC